MWFRTSRLVLTAGGGTGGTPLNAFDNALRHAGIADFNLLKVSSIAPPEIPISFLTRGRQISGQGLLVPAVFESLECNEVGREISAAVGIGVPRDVKAAGMIFTCSCHGPAELVQRSIRMMIDEGMGLKGVAKYDYKIAYETLVVAPPNTCVVASAIFCEEDSEPLFAGHLSA